MGHTRNLMLRLTITYIVLSVVSALPGIRLGHTLFSTWIASFAFVLLSRFVRPLLLALTLPLTITTAGLFIFVVDGVLLMLTDLLTGLEIAGFGWAVVGSVTMGITNIWVESGFKRLGWLEREREDDPVEIVSPGWALRLLLGVGLLLGIVFSGLTAFQVGLAFSTVTRNLALLAVATLVTLLAVSMGASWLVAEGLEAAHRARFSGLVGGFTTFAGIAMLAFVAFDGVRPPPDPEPLAGTAYWELPTGSRIAYYPYPATSPSSDVPIVYLHDGPGFCVLDEERGYFHQFADLGFDVYLYDRAGVGRSAWFSSIDEYGLSRDIADLDAIREELGVHEMILVGQGAGAELAARYLSRHPERVRQAVLLSPTPLSSPPTIPDYTRTAAPAGPKTVLEPRLQLASAMAAYGPEAAQNLASQAEMRVLLERSFDSRMWVCPEHVDQAPRVEHPGFNAYVALRKEATSRELPDPRPALADNLTPSLILAGECDYLPWRVIEEYREALLNETVFVFEDAGHAIYLTQGKLLTDIIQAFLLDAEFPIEPYSGEQGAPSPAGLQLQFVP